VVRFFARHHWGNVKGDWAIDTELTTHNRSWIAIQPC
jgi:hypothetical protein